MLDHVQLSLMPMAFLLIVLFDFLLLLVLTPVGRSCVIATVDKPRRLFDTLRACRVRGDVSQVCCTCRREAEDCRWKPA